MSVLKLQGAGSVFSFLFLFLFLFFFWFSFFERHLKQQGQVESQDWLLALASPSNGFPQ
jgi:hypothetical protein